MSIMCAMRQRPASMHAVTLLLNSSCSVNAHAREPHTQAVCVLNNGLSLFRCGKWAIQMGDYKDGVVGGKSKNLAALRGQLPADIRLPASVTLPFGCFEEALNDKANKEVKQRLEAAAKKVPDAPAEHLAECREAVDAMTVPGKARAELEKAMAAAELPVPEGEERWAAAERALVAVWASKFNDRAFYSTRKVRAFSSSTWLRPLGSANPWGGSPCTWTPARVACMAGCS